MILSLIFAFASVASAALSPIARCTVESEGLCGIRWGYENDGPDAFVPHGIENGFSLEIDDPAPVKFRGGRHEAEFQTLWKCSRGPLRWTLDDGSGPRSATALNFDTCDCQGSGCLASSRVSAIFGDRSVVYSTSGGSCEPKKMVLELDGCRPLRREIDKAAGDDDDDECEIEYRHPYEIEGARGNLTFESATFEIGEIALEGKKSCARCETFVPVCPREPTTLEPTLEQTTLEPTTLEPTLEQTTLEPTRDPTLEPTTREPTLEPTREPTTRDPTLEPTTREPTLEPTLEPTTREPTTREPTLEPTTREPTREPTLEPTTREPTLEPTTREPTREPTTRAPAPTRPPNRPKPKPKPKPDPPIAVDDPKARGNDPPAPAAVPAASGEPIGPLGWTFIGLSIAATAITSGLTCFLFVLYARRRRGQ